MGDKRKFTTSDVNFTAYLTYHNVPIKNTTTSREGNRIRVWFEFEMEEAEFTKHKNDFFSQSEESKVTAQRLFQERDRVYSLMIQVRNSITT